MWPSVVSSKDARRIETVKIEFLRDKIISEYQYCNFSRTRFTEVLKGVYASKP